MDTSKEFPQADTNDLNVRHYLESFCEKAKDILNKQSDLPFKARQ